MRENKFRAWDGEKMHRVCRLGMRGFSTDLWSSSPIACDSRTTETLDIMQYIGRHDKSEAEIYEGDWFVTERGESGIVEWKCDGWAVSGYDPCANTVMGDYCDDHIDWDRGEVIGNRFENPGLLK